MVATARVTCPTSCSSSWDPALGSLSLSRVHARCLGVFPSLKPNAEISPFHRFADDCSLCDFRSVSRNRSSFRTHRSRHEILRAADSRVKMTRRFSLSPQSRGGTCLRSFRFSGKQRRKKRRRSAQNSEDKIWAAGNGSDARRAVWTCASLNANLSLSTVEPFVSRLPRETQGAHRARI